MLPVTTVGQRCVQRKGAGGHSFLRLAFAWHRLALAYSGFARNRITYFLPVKSGVDLARVCFRAGRGQTGWRPAAFYRSAAFMGPTALSGLVSQPCWRVPRRMGSSQSAPAHPALCTWGHYCPASTLPLAAPILGSAWAQGPVDTQRASLQSVGRVLPPGHLDQEPHLVSPTPCTAPHHQQQLPAGGCRWKS